MVVRLLLVVLGGGLLMVLDVQVHDSLLLYGHLCHVEMLPFFLCSGLL